MKRISIVAGLCFGLAVTTNAQTAVYSQNFEGNHQDILDEGWGFPEITGACENRGIVSSNNSTQNAGFTGSTAGYGTFNIVNQIPQHIPDVDGAIISPLILLPAGQSTLTYRIGSISIGGATGTHYSVYVLTKTELEQINGDVAVLKTTLNGKTPHDSATISGQSSTISLDISDFEGTESAVVFRVHDTPGNKFLLIDDVSIVNGTLGNEDFMAGEFSVYPNPAVNFITVNSNNLLDFESITITDINGRTVLDQKLNGATDAQIDISGLSAGMYMLAAASDKGTATKKIIKQ